MNPLKRTFAILVTGVFTLAAGLLTASGAAFAWEPKKPVEFIIMAGTGGGADQIARLLQGLIEKKDRRRGPSSRSTSRVARAPKRCVTWKTRPVTSTRSWSR